MVKALLAQHVRYLPWQASNCTTSGPGHSCPIPYHILIECGAQVAILHFQPMGHDSTTPRIGDAYMLSRPHNCPGVRCHRMAPKSSMAVVPVHQCSGHPLALVEESPHPQVELGSTPRWQPEGQLPCCVSPPWSSIRQHACHWVLLVPPLRDA